MAEIKFANYVRKTIADASGITAVATSVTLNTVTGLPTIGAGDWFYLVFVRLSDYAMEIVKVTAVNTTTYVCTIVRAQGGTTALAMDYADRAELWMTADGLNDLRTQLEAAIAAGSTQGDLTRGSILAGDASGVAAELVAKTSGQILVGDGTDLKSVAVSGDATLSAAGALSIGATKVTNAMLAGSIAHTKLATLNEGSILVGNASNQAEALDAKGDTKVLIGNGMTVAPYALSGDVTMTNGGVVTVSATKEGWPQVATVTLSAADIRTLFSAPVTLIASPGGTLALIPENVILCLNYTAAAHPAGYLYVRYTNAAGVVACSPAINTFLSGAADAYYCLHGDSPYNAGYNYGHVVTPNAPLVLATGSDLGGTGDGTLQVVIHYRVVDCALV